MAAAFTSTAYHRESAVYQEWLPELRKLREAKGLNEAEIPLRAAEPYYVNFALTDDGQSYDKSTVFVLQELKSEGYRMNPLAITAAGIDLEHATLAIRTYANYHALSIARLRQLKKADGTYDLSPNCSVFTKKPYFIDPAEICRAFILPSYSKVLRHLKHNQVCIGIISLTECCRNNSFIN